MATITGLSAKDLAKYQSRSRDVINQFDRNGDGVLDPSENEVYLGRDRSTYSTRFGDYVEFTTVTSDNYMDLDMAAFKKADANHDGKLTADEMTNAYLADRDSNHDGKLSGWEKFKMGFSGINGMFTNSRSVEVGRSSYTVYDPQPTYDPGYSRPVPPPVNGGYTRPTPPPVNGGYSRPVPPPVTGGYSRPVPPPIN